MVNSIHNFIRTNGLTSTLRCMVEYAETQAHLYHSFGDQDQCVYWVRVWANLIQSSENIQIGVDMGESLRLWDEYIYWETHDESNGCFE